MKPRRLRVATPPPDHEPSWSRIQNLVYLAEQDDLFGWLRNVRAYLDAHENEKRRRRGAA